ncbi:MAG: hypothetical protein ACO1NM_08450 [Sphingobium phenoxybenzoativorans]
MRYFLGSLRTGQEIAISFDSNLHLPIAGIRGDGGEGSVGGIPYARHAAQPPETAIRLANGEQWSRFVMPALYGAHGSHLAPRADGASDGLTLRPATPVSLTGGQQQ